MNSVIRLNSLSAFICAHLWLIACFLPVAAYAQETLTVAVASSLYSSMQEKADAFEKAHDVNIRLVSGSTGRLYNQIMQGAPFDMFIAADHERPALLAQHGKAVKQFALGQGFVGVMAGKKVLEDITALKNPAIRHIAIANPDVAPFGKVSKAVLIQHGLWVLLKPKFVYAQNAMQAAMMVDKGLVDAGFIPVSSGLSFVAMIPYVGVLLTDKAQARNLMQEVKQTLLNPASPGGEASASQKRDSQRSASPQMEKPGAPEGALPNTGDILTHPGGEASASQQRASQGSTLPQLDKSGAPEGALPNTNDILTHPGGEASASQKTASQKPFRQVVVLR